MTMSHALDASLHMEIRKILISVTIGRGAPSVRNGFMKHVLRSVGLTREQPLRVMLAVLKSIGLRNRIRSRQNCNVQLFLLFGSDCLCMPLFVYVYISFVELIYFVKKNMSKQQQKG